MVIVDKPVFVGDEIRFYYTGYNRPHNDTQGKTAMGRATHPGERGILLTRP